MNTTRQKSKVFGAAFLFQFVTSFTSSAVLKPLWFVPGNISQTMLNIAGAPWLMRAAILLDGLTALGVIVLGSVLFLALRKQNEKIALTALGFYILEGALLAASKAQSFALLRISQEYASAASPFLLALGQVTYDAMDFAGNTLHMLAFCFGAILFYTLLYQSGIVPRALSLWGLITVIPCLVGTLLAIVGLQAPFAIYVPYVPFEIVIGVWILVKGIQDVPEIVPNRAERLAAET